MRIYDKVKRFDSKTGNPIEKWTFKENRCDFTGKVLDYENSFCEYNLNYCDQDPCFGASNGEYEFGKEFEIDMHEFLGSTYHFYSDTETENCAEADMMKEALEGCNDPKNEWYRCSTFDSICRHARLRTAKKLIEDKVITSEQLECFDVS